MFDDSLGEETPTSEIDESLGEATPQPEDAVADDFGEPEDFDFSAWVSGVRPTRRSVRITARADLLSELDELTLLITQHPEDDRAGLRELQAEFEELRSRVIDSQRRFVVEARTDARLREVVKNLGITQPSQKKKAELREYNITVNLAQLADAIVIPSGVTVEGLRKLYDVVPSEVDRLIGAVAQAKTAAPEVPPNFSQRR